MSNGKPRGRSPEAKARRAIVRKRVIAAEKRMAALQPEVVDAAERRLVILPDGRTGRLLSVPAQSSHVSAGAKARVELRPGVVVSVPLSDLRVLA